MDRWFTGSMILNVALVLLVISGFLHINMLTSVTTESLVRTHDFQMLAEINDDLNSNAMSMAIKYQDILTACDGHRVSELSDADYYQAEDDGTTELLELHRKRDVLLEHRDALLEESPEPSEDLEIPSEYLTSPTE